MANGTLYIGDNLEVMREKIRSDCIDLVYLDPPYNSKRDYNCNFNDAGQDKGFADTWSYLEHQKTTDEEFNKLKIADDKLAHFLSFVKEGAAKDCNHFAYMTFMASRLKEIHRVLKPTGSVYLHVDPTESHYLKIVMDLIFGADNFRNEIIWSYKRWTASKKSLPGLHDTILMYTKSRDYYFDLPLVKNDKPNPSQYVSVKINGKTCVKRDSDGVPIKRDIKEYVSVGDVWELPILSPVAKERLGYPTQKPEALLERIISTSCPQDGIMLDPFCGCGTSCAVAAKKGIAYVGIDVTSIARAVIEKRFIEAGQPKPDTITIMPSNVVEAMRLAESDKHASQVQVCYKLGLVGSQKKGADSGIDGHRNYVKQDGSPFKVVASVKSGGSTLSQLRDLIGVVVREKSDVGLFITRDAPTKAMLMECNKHGCACDGIPKIQMLTIKEVYEGTPIKLPAGVKSE